LIERLLKAGISMLAPEQRDGHLRGKTFVLTGTLASMSRSEAEERIRGLGGLPGSSVSKKTDYLVVGADPGSKLEKAERLKVPILDERAFLHLLGLGKLPSAINDQSSGLVVQSMGLETQFVVENDDADY
jgi:DNA ligase (NAD+)